MLGCISVREPTEQSKSFRNRMLSMLKKMKIDYRDKKIMSNECSKEMKKQNKMQAIFCSAVKSTKQLEISL